MDEGDSVIMVHRDGSLKKDLKLPADDEEIYKELKKVWEARENRTVYFTVMSAVGKGKIISARTNE